MDRPRPTIRQVEYFIAIAKALNFNRAAKRLGVSQPTLTTQIVSFEEALGIQLFERSRSGTVLTTVGRELLPHAVFSGGAMPPREGDVPVSAIWKAAEEGQAQVRAEPLRLSHGGAVP